ncbi:MAG: ferrous iron transport protein A [Oscillospiraceae bacterium]|nr:ferrous iron transport protein A [Oscillospiraceae bacterium]
MNTPFALDRLKDGESAYVIELGNEASMRRRLADLGLVPGTRVTCLYRSPAGDPAAYLIRGAVIALRRRDAGRVRARPCPLSA